MAIEPSKPEEKPTETDSEPDHLHEAAPHNEADAEQHVEQLMGPAVYFDSKAKGGSVSSAPELPDDIAVPVKPASDVPDDDIDSINQKLKAQVDGNADLDMEELPTDFNSTGDEKLANDAAVNQAVRDALLHTDKPEVVGVPTPPPVVMKQSIFARMRMGFLRWWDNPWKRYGTLLVLAVVIGIVAGVPRVRTLFLDTVGVRSSIIVTAYDQTTNLPLKHVSVKAQGVAGKTDENGKVRLYDVRLGKQTIEISKPGFATVKRPIDLGMRVIDLGDVDLKAVGLQYSFVLSDYVSGKPLSGVEVTSGEASTKSDKKGKAILTVDPQDDSDREISVGGGDFRVEKLDAPEDPAKPIAVTLVPSAMELFVSRESGKYDVYKMYIDGKAREVLLPGTGREGAQILLSPDTDGKRVAVVSTRDDKRNKDGYLLQTLTIVDVSDGAIETVDHSEQFVLFGWKDDTMIYLQTIAGTSAANAGRQKIFAYDVASGKRYQLAAANYFAGAFLAGGKLYYTVSSTDPNSQESFSFTNLDGTGKRTIFNGNVWSMVRGAYDRVHLQTSDNKWHEYKLGGTGLIDGTPPNDYATPRYIDSPDGKHAVWVDVRDSSGAIIVRELGDGKNTELLTKKYARSAVRWLNDRTFVIRTVQAGVYSDHAVSIDGTEAKFITEVSASQRDPNYGE